MTFGKYKGKPVAWVLIEDPSYLKWMHGENMNDKKEYIFAMKLVDKLDAMPYTEVRCHGNCNGHNPVTKLTLYKGRYNMSYWFCDTCDPYSAGALPGRLNPVKNVKEVLFHPDANHIIKEMALAKGAPKRKTKSALKNFFNY